MSNKTKIPFTLSQDIRPEDYLVIANQGVEAFLPDVQTRLKLFNLPTEPISDSYVRNWLSLPSCHVVKAVSLESNEIMGCVCWGTRGYVPRPPRPERTQGRFTEGSGEEGTKTKIQQLEDLSDGHFVQFMTDIMPEGTKCWFISSLNVAPKFQGMGVGRALMEWGFRRADEDGVFAWVHSSEMAWRAYRACGFEVVRELRLILDDYAEGEAVGKGPEEGGKWGIYVFRYMVYKPERALGFVGK
ncbi:hypothetical protein N431DRAFT_551128 [Stipitochalara longipes BDJ]|nr:hypothetical protein N431DRAFT_551128 [Stipitochalara longipes BDJ]